MSNKKLMDNAKKTSTGENIIPLQITNYLDNTKTFWKKQPFFYDKTKIFWMWNLELYKYEMVDEVDMMNAIEKSLQFGGATVTTHTKSNYLEAFKRVGRLNIPKPPPPTWVQFQDKICDVKTKKYYKATPSYFITNPIPHKLGTTKTTPVIDKIMSEWVGKYYVKSLKQIMAFCMIPSYFLNRIFVFYGSGSNGKTKFLELIQVIIGIINCCSTELELIMNNRFESSSLYKKLVCMMGETNFDSIKRTDRIKKLSGGKDLIRYEIKNKSTFEDYNYAKLIINTNSMPITKDKTRAFHRRMFCIKFPNEFNEKKDILEEIPPEEINNLCTQCLQLLQELLKEREFHGEGTIDDREQKYEEISNPINTFIQEHCVSNVSYDVPVFEFYDRYIHFLKSRGFRVITKKELTNQLSDNGYESDLKKHKKLDGTWTNWRHYIGIRLKKGLEKFTCPKKCVETGLDEKEKKVTEAVVTLVTDGTGNPTQIPIIGDMSETPVTSVTSVTNPKFVDELVEVTEEKINVVEERLNEDDVKHNIKSRVNLIKIIEELDEGNGVTVSTLSDVTGLNDADLLERLGKLKFTGDIFEPKPGFWKVL